jgi:hypothetical protein
MLNFSSLLRMVCKEKSGFHGRMVGFRIALPTLRIHSGGNFLCQTCERLRRGHFAEIARGHAAILNEKIA